MSMMPRARNCVVVTDLDGTLLDHVTYSWQSAEPALAYLRDAKIPLILASSKTAAEIIPLRQTLGFSHCPAVIENGAGLLSANSEELRIKPRYQEIRETLNALPEDMRASFQGFGDWTVKEVMDKTGLSQAGAIAAKKRDYSEPGLWFGSDERFADFAKTLGDKGIASQRGGRFTTLSFGADKADQIGEIRTLYRSADSALPYVIALGDAPNDQAMLEAADLGIIIPNESHKGVSPLAGEATGTIIRADLIGPAGWNKALMAIFTRFQEGN